MGIFVIKIEWPYHSLILIMEIIINEKIFLMLKWAPALCYWVFCICCQWWHANEYFCRTQRTFTVIQTYDIEQAIHIYEIIFDYNSVLYITGVLLSFAFKLAFRASLQVNDLNIWHQSYEIVESSSWTQTFFMSLGWCILHEFCWILDLS